MAKARGREMSETIELWFRRTYSLPPTDPRYLAMTRADIEAEYWACHYDDRRRAGKPAEEEFEDDDFDLEAVINEAEADDWEEV